MSKIRSVFIINCIFFFKIERARRAIRVFFLIRELCLSLGIEKDNHILPLTNPKSCIPIDHALDLSELTNIVSLLVM